MNKKPVIIITGGESRNLGKTEFVCRLIECIKSGLQDNQNQGSCAKIPAPVRDLIIRKTGISPENKKFLIGIKIKTLRPGESAFHGGRSAKEENETLSFIINEDTKESDDALSGKDTLRMKKSGADRVFRVRTRPESLKEMWEEIKDRTAVRNNPDEDTIILCESNSLRSILEPDIFIMIKRMPLSCGSPASAVKESAGLYSELADITVYSDGISFY